VDQRKMTPNQTAPCEGEADLLPCPFCGSRNLNPHFHRHFGQVECMDCGCQLPLPEKSPETQAACWNRRSPVPTAPVGVDREKVARIIAPDAFLSPEEWATAWPGHNRQAYDPREAPSIVSREIALSKADAILRAVSTTPGKAGGE
jgi:hypothetical protein